MAYCKILLFLVVFSSLDNDIKGQQPVVSSTPQKTYEVIEEDSLAEEDTTAISTLLNYFDGEYSALFDSARKNKKYIILDFTADWCLPCKQMDKYTFNDKDLTDYLNNEYVVYRVNMEDFDAFEIAKNYSVGEYPTFIFLNFQKKILQIVTGFQSAKKMLSIAKKYRI